MPSSPPTEISSGGVTTSSGHGIIPRITDMPGYSNESMGPMLTARGIFANPLMVAPSTPAQSTRMLPPSSIAVPSKNKRKRGPTIAVTNKPAREAGDGTEKLFYEGTRLFTNIVGSSSKQTNQKQTESTAAFSRMS